MSVYDSDRCHTQFIVIIRAYNSNCRSIYTSLYSLQNLASTWGFKFLTHLYYEGRCRYSKWQGDLMSIQKLKTAGGMATGGIALIAFLSLPIIFLMGAATFSVWALKWIPSATGIAFFVCLVLIPFAVIPPTRRFAASMYQLISLVFAICMWLYALAFTYLKWGLLGVVLGIMFVGVGVVFAGAIAAIISATWVVLGNLAIFLVLYLGTRALGIWLEHLADERQRLIDVGDARPTAITTRDSDI